LKINLDNARLSAINREWLTNVYPFYLHDLSEFDDHYYTLNERGVWEPDYLPSWLKDDQDHTLIICESGRRVGFALVNEAPSPYIEPGIRFRLSEFFVLRKYRRCGIGRRAALALFDQFRGSWQLSVLPRNKPAICFWDQVTGEYPGGGCQETKRSGDVVYVFDSSL
jgi:predicted acetyltransferase